MPHMYKEFFLAGVKGTSIVTFMVLVGALIYAPSLLYLPVVILAAIAYFLIFGLIPLAIWCYIFQLYRNRFSPNSSPVFSTAFITLILFIIVVPVCGFIYGFITGDEHYISGVIFIIFSAIPVCFLSSIFLKMKLKA